MTTLWKRRPRGARIDTESPGVRLETVQNTGSIKTYFESRIKDLLKDRMWWEREKEVARITARFCVGHH